MSEDIIHVTPSGYKIRVYVFSIKIANRPILCGRFTADSNRRSQKERLPSLRSIPSTALCDVDSIFDSTSLRLLVLIAKSVEIRSANTAADRRPRRFRKRRLCRWSFDVVGSCRLSESVCVGVHRVQDAQQRTQCVQIGVSDVYSVNTLIMEARRCRCGVPVQRGKQRLLINRFIAALE